MQPGFIKSCRTVAAIVPYAIIAFAGARNQVRQAAAATDPLAGITDSQGGSAGGMVDVQFSLFAEARAGGPIAAGDRITSDANGCAVKATKQAGQIISYVGIAQVPAVAGDIFDVLIAPGFIDG
ncbi:MAG: hypothetical protein K2X91_09925 [Thermoleophilia bacterium]|nr:hypothetical protein [Thermoleophilia bacterium]